jgi:hypothetical protein
MAGGDQLRGGGRQQDQGRVDGTDCAADGVGQRAIDAGLVVQRAVRFDMADANTLHGGDADQGADLRGKLVLQFRRRQRHGAATEVAQVGVARVGADRNAVFPRQTQRPPHDVRVAGVAAAGYIGRIDDGQHGGIVAHGPRAVALAEVGVEVNSWHR